MARKPRRAPLEMPNATMVSGMVLGISWPRLRRSKAAIILLRPASRAPASSARNSRRRENHMTMALARMASTISATMVVIQ